MEVQNGLGDREPEAGAFAGRFGGEEGIEDFRQLVGGDSGAVVLDLGGDDEIACAEDLRACVANIGADTGKLAGGGADGDAAAGGRDGGGGVGEEIGEDLADLQAIDAQGREIGGEVADDLDMLRG